MATKINPTLTKSIKEFSKNGRSIRSIKKTLSEGGHDVSVSTIYRVIKDIGKKRSAVARGKPIPKNKYPKKKCTKSVLKRIDNLTSKPNPPSQRAIAQRVNMSQPMVHKIIHQDLQKKVMKKAKVHRLRSEERRV